MNLVQTPNCFPQMGGVTKGARLEKERAGTGSHFASCPSEAVTSSRVKWETAGGRAFYGCLLTPAR